MAGQGAGKGNGTYEAGAALMAIEPEFVTYPQVTRIEVIDNEGRRFIQYYSAGISAVLQDDGRTLKVFAGERAVMQF